MGSKPPRRRNRDDDDDDDPRPVPRRRKEESSSSPLLLILGLAGLGVVLSCACAGLGIGGYLIMDKAPQPGPIVRDGPFEPRQDIFPRNNDDPPKRDRDIAPPGDPLKTIKEPSTRLLIDANASLVKDIVFAPEANGVAYLFWEAGSLKKKLDYWDWKAQRRLARIDLPDLGQQIGLSPKGTRLLFQKTFPPALTAWSLPGGQQLFKDWNPYARDAKKPFVPNAPELLWAYYLDEDHVLTLARSGQFDVWNMTQNKIVASNPPPAKSTFLMINGFARAPQDFTLSPSRKLLAIKNGDGFDMFDAFTARRVGKTEAFAPAVRVTNIWSVAFNREGTKLASRFHLLPGGGKSADFVAVWDVPTGVKKSQQPVTQNIDASGPMCWLGPRHLMLFDGNVFKGAVFSLDDGRFHRVCEDPSPSNHFARLGPDDRIWYQSGATVNVQAQLLAVDLPVNDLVQQPAPPGNNVPRWYFTPNGITLNRP